MPDQNNSEATSQVDESLSILNSLSAGEVEMAKKHGYFKDADTTKKTSEESGNGNEDEESVSETSKSEESVNEESEQEDSSKEKELLDKKPLHSTDLDDKFDRMDADPSVEHEELSKFTAEQKSFFWKWKKDKKKRQEAEAKAELLQLQLKQASAPKDNIKDLDKILEEEEIREKKKQPLTREEYEAMEAKKENAAKAQQFIVSQLREHEAEARSKYENFDEVVDEAEKIIKNDPLYYHMYIQHVQDPKANAAEFAYKLGMINYRPKLVEKANVDVKRKTTASLPSTHTTEVKKKTYADLDIGDVAKMSTTEWMKIPRDVRNKYLNM